MQKKIIIVSDSSANLYQSNCADFMPVPLKIVAGQKEYVDDEALDVAGMLADLREYKGRSSTACPGVGDWLQAFGDAEEVYGVSLTSPAATMQPALQRRTISLSIPTERCLFWIPCPPAQSWSC